MFTSPCTSIYPLCATVSLLLISIRLSWLIEWLLPIFFLEVIFSVYQASFVEDRWDR